MTTWFFLQNSPYCWTRTVRCWKISRSIWSSGSNLRKSTRFLYFFPFLMLVHFLQSHSHKSIQLTGPNFLSFMYICIFLYICIFFNRFRLCFWWETMWPSSCHSSWSVKAEMHVCYRLEIAFTDKTVVIIAKSKKTLQDALSVVMQKHQLKPQDALVTIVRVSCIQSRIKV